MADVQPPGEGRLHRLARFGRARERDLCGVGKAVRALREGSGRHGQEVGFYEICCVLVRLSIYRGASSVKELGVRAMFLRRHALSVR